MPSESAAESCREVIQKGRHGLDRLGQRLPVVDEDVAPHGRVGTGHPGEVGEARAHPLQSALTPHAEAPRMLHESVGQHVRQVTDNGKDTIVRGRVDVSRARAQIEDELLQHGIQLGEGSPSSAQEVVGALE